jgi:hypothetical protein
MPIRARLIDRRRLLNDEGLTVLGSLNVKYVAIAFRNKVSKNLVLIGCQHCIFVFHYKMGATKFETLPLGKPLHYVFIWKHHEWVNQVFNPSRFAK